MIKTILFVLLAVIPGIGAVFTAHVTPVLSAKTAGELIVANMLSRDFMLYGEESLHYSEAATAVGALRFAAASSNPTMLRKLVGRYQLLLDDNSPLVSRRAHVDMNVIGIVPLEIAILTGDSGQLHQGLSFSDSQWDNPREDGLFFHSPDVPFLRGRGNGWSALTTLIDAEGNLQEVCIGTGKKNDLDYYLTRPRVSGDYHGQAPVLWLATLLLP